MESLSDLARAADGLDAVRREIATRAAGGEPDDRFGFVIAALIDLMDEVS